MEAVLVGSLVLLFFSFGLKNLVVSVDLILAESVLYLYGILFMLELSLLALDVFYTNFLITLYLKFLCFVELDSML